MSESLSILPRWHCYQGEANDCGPFAAAIAINALKNEPAVDPTALARWLERRQGVQLPGRVPRWATFPWGVVRMLRAHGLGARWRPFAKRESLARNIRRGIVTIVLVGEPFRFRGGRWAGWMHYKVLYGRQGERWLFVDPASREPIVSETDAVFSRQWRNGAQIIIETWKVSR